MKFRVNTFVLCSVLCWCFASTAQAGFVAPDYQEDLSYLTQSQPKSGPAERTPGPSQEESRQIPALHTMQGLESLLGHSSGGSMSGGSTNSSVGSAAIAILHTPRSEREQPVLFAELPWEEFLTVPIPFLDGIFRPPRQA